MLCGSRRKPAKETRAPPWKWDKKKGKTETGSERQNNSFYFFPKLWQNEVTVNVAEVCARVFLRVCDLPHVVVWPLGCQNWGFSYSTGCNLCANTPALIFPLGNLWFWSIYLQEQSCTMIPCVFLLCAQVPVFWLCVLPSAFFFLPTHKSLAQTRTRFLVCALLFLRISLQASVSLRHSLARVCVGELEWLRRSRVLPGELARAAAALFVFHCCSNNGSPWAGSPPNWETAAREWDAVQSDRVAFYAGSISRASTLTSTISSIIHQAMLPG